MGSQPLGHAFRPICDIGLSVKRFAKESMNVAPSRLSKNAAIIVCLTDRLTDRLTGEV